MRSIKWLCCPWPWVTSNHLKPLQYLHPLSTVNPGQRQTKIRKAPTPISLATLFLLWPWYTRMTLTSEHDLEIDKVKQYGTWFVGLTRFWPQTASWSLQLFCLHSLPACRAHRHTDYATCDISYHTPMQWTSMLVQAVTNITVVQQFQKWPTAKTKLTQKLLEKLKKWHWLLTH